MSLCCESLINPCFGCESPNRMLHLALGVADNLSKALKELWSKAEEWPISLQIKCQLFHDG